MFAVRRLGYFVPAVGQGILVRFLMESVVAWRSLVPTAAAIDSHSLYDDLQGTFTQTLEGFARALEAKDSLYAWSF